MIRDLKTVVGASVVFKSDWRVKFTAHMSKVKELHTGGKFAVAGKTVTLRKHVDTASIPLCKISVADGIGRQS